ncbi:MAG TPA: hypothetical protein VK524_12560, partial [Polyangiaceae bacterium]|nr:hypothetical protein [Polyangiaceae bacterium]
MRVGNRRRGGWPNLPRLLQAVLFGVCVAVIVLGSRTAQAQCVDEALKEQLIGRRAYRGVVPRLF